MFIYSWHQCLQILEASTVGEEICIETYNPELFSEALRKSLLFFKAKYEFKTSREVMVQNATEIVEHELAHFKVAKEHNVKAYFRFILLFTQDEKYQNLRRDACIVLPECDLSEENISNCTDILFLQKMLEIIEAPNDMSDSDIEQSELLRKRIRDLTK
jgi:hypothetical protein